MIKGLLGRLGLAARIGAAIAAAVIAIQVLVTLVFLTHPPNFHPFYSARWLSGSAVEIIKNAMAGATEPSSVLRNLANAEFLSVRFDRAPPRRATSDPPWPLNRVLATVRSELGGPAAPTVEAVGMGPSDEAIPVVPADASEALPSGPLRSGEDLLAPPIFVIAADLHDGRWITIEPSFRAQRRRLMRSLAFIFIGTLLIAAIAVLTARSLIAPLSQLATAADALGRSPEIIETPCPGIREFAAIYKAFETTVPGHVFRVGAFFHPGNAPRMAERGGYSRREYVALRFRQIGRDRHIGVGHRAEHRLHGGRMPLHPFQPFARISRERARGVFDAGAFDHAGRRSQCAFECPPGFLLARFGSDFRLEIGEFRREQGAPLHARRGVVLRRGISPRIHGAKTPKSGARKGDHNESGSGRPG